MSILGVLMIFFYHIPAIPHIGNTDRLEDAFDAFTQMSNNTLLRWAVVTNIISIAFFNFFGISITKRMSGKVHLQPYYF